MKHVISIAMSLFVFGAAPVMAADIPVKARPVAPVVAAPAYNWSGCYVGGYIGGAWGRDVSVLEGVLQPAGVFSYNVTTAPYSYRLGSSFIGGGTVGCNYQANVLVVGFEGELGYLRLRGSVADPNSVDCGLRHGGFNARWRLVWDGDGARRRRMGSRPAVCQGRRGFRPRGIQRRRYVYGRRMRRSERERVREFEPRDMDPGRRPGIRGLAELVD